MEIVNKPRSKTFVSMDSLWYEEERLSTFIDWPVSFISPQELAREGFYYLRTKDHCACAFCRGIIGAWEQGDTPRGEHLRHFPHCPFVQGKVTPNVPITQGSILARVSREVSADVGSAPTGIDVCGLGKPDTLQEYCKEGRILTKSSSAEVSMSSLGFRQYCGPKRKEYLTTETRLNSFKHWPEKVKQTPEELSEAGFYYCGLSDHVRCFHCGKGLRNWEPDDDPWVEHARWFPDCHFVLLKKGVEYVDKVRRENPPYIPVRNRPLLNAASATASSSPKPLTLNDDEMDKLMELQIMKHVLDMGFAPHVVVKALRKKLMESGQPFFSVEACIDAVLLILEEETKNTIHGCEDITAQVRKMAAIESSNTSNLNTSSRSETLSRGSAPSSGITLPTLPARQENVASNVSVSSLPPLPNNNFTTTTSTVSIPPILNISRASPPLRSSTPTSHLEQANSQSMITETEPETAEGSPSPITLNDSSNDVTTVENTSQTENAIGNSAPISSNSENISSNDEPMELPAEVATLISEADDVMEEAAKLLGTSASSSSSSSSTSSSLSTSPSSGSSSQTSSSSHESHSSLESNASSSQESSSETSGPSSLTTTSSSSDESLSPPRSPLKKDIKIKPQTKLEEKIVLHKAGDTKTENLAMELQRIKENMMCKVCMDKEMDVVFLPCTHMVTCSSCAVALASCPICRRDIQYAFKPIIS